MFDDIQCYAPARYYFDTPLRYYATLPPAITPATPCCRFPLYAAACCYDTFRYAAAISLLALSASCSATLDAAAFAYAYAEPQHDYAAVARHAAMRRYAAAFAAA